MAQIFTAEQFKRLGVSTQIGGGISTIAAPQGEETSRFKRLEGGKGFELISGFLPGSIQPPAPAPPPTTITPIDGRIIKEPFDEEEVRRVELKKQQERIALTEREFERRVAREEEIGARDVARSNVISAITGMTGAPEATTRAGQAERRTEERVSRVQDLKRLAILDIFDKIDANVRREKEIALADSQAEQERITEEVRREAATILLGLSSQGLNWEEARSIDPDNFDALVRETGKNPFETRKLYEDSLPQEKKPDVIFEGWRGSNWVVIRKNIETGETTTEIITAEEIGIPSETKGGNIRTITAGNSVYWYDADLENPVFTRLGAKPGAKPRGPTEVPTFEEFLSEAQEFAKQSFTLEMIESLRVDYDAEVGSISPDGGFEYEDF